MKKIFVLSLIVFSFFIISCSKINEPELNEDIITPVSDCYIVGLEVDFVDTCSYSFGMNFLSGFDSVNIQYSMMGADFYIYADSGDYDYWLDYFESDTTNEYIFRNNSSSDSLMLQIRVTGEKPIGEEEQRFSQINHLQIISIEEHKKYVSIIVPENSEETWVEILIGYSFISQVFIIGVCTDS